MGPPPSPVLGYLIVPMGSSRPEKAAKALARPVKCPAGYVKSGEFGGARRDRTADLVNAIHALSQLSYGPLTPGIRKPGDRFLKT